MRLNLRSLPLVRQLQILFFISGFSALVLEVVYVKLLRYWAGNTAAAVAAVLCAYMAGLAGEGDLYTHEFYEFCSARLLDSGVLQQWLPLFDLSLRDTVIILRTVRQVFPYVTLYMGAESGMIVASRSPLEVNYARLREMDSNPQLARLLASLQLPRVFSLLGDCIFVPEGLDAFLAPSPERRISTDLWPHLEYSNARFYLVNPSSRALRLHLLSAQEFRTPPIIGAEGATRGAIQEYAFAERSRLVQTFPPR